MSTVNSPALGFWTSEAVDRAISFHPSLAGAETMRWRETLSVAAGAGFSTTDVALTMIDCLQANEICESLQAVRIAVGGMRLPVSLHGDEHCFRSEIVDLPRRAKLAAEIGATSMYRAIPPATTIPKSELLPLLRERIADCATILAHYGIRLGIEVVGPMHLRRQAPHEAIWSLSEATDFILSCGPNAGLLLDSWHWHHAGATADDILEAGRLICHVHLADAPDLPAELIHDRERLLPGQGVIDFACFFSALRAIGYSGSFTPEIFGHRRQAQTPTECAMAGRRAVARVLEQHLLAN